MNDLAILESRILIQSSCYRDSDAFQLAMDYIRLNNTALYEKLLLMEGTACGAID